VFYSTTPANHSANGLEQTLLQRAASVREKIGIMPSHDNLFYPSAYEKSNGMMRGFSNWIIPNRIMVGQYPGQNPEVDGPSTQEVQAHIESIAQDAGINLFCSLQSEIPPQTDYEAWAEGEIYLEMGLRREFPRPFTHYAPVVRSVTPDCQFIHNPIVDLSVPNSESLQSLLSQLLEAIDEEDRCIYIHCWGGRGRAGLTSACLLSLLWPELDASASLDWVQAGYDSRLGAKSMPGALSKSPQTETQRQLVKEFVQERQRGHKRRL
jgi:protein-tyrosine phosphatase